jgi:hypothetical protein
MRRHPATWILAVVALMGGGAAALGQELRFDAQNFKPALDPWGYITMDGAKTLGQLQIFGAGYFNWSHNPLRLSKPRPPSEGGSRDVIRDLSEFDIVAALGLLEFRNGGLEIAADLPLAADVNGIEIETRPHHTHPIGLSDQGVGDLRTGAKLTIFDREDDAIGLAGKVVIEWPTGKEGPFLSDNREFQMLFSLIVDKKMSVLRFGAEFGYEWIDGRDFHIADVHVNDRMHVKAAIGLEPFDEKIPLAVVAELIHWTRWERPWAREKEAPIELNGAIKYSGTIFGEIGAGGGLNSGVGAPDARVFAAVGFMF